MNAGRRACDLIDQLYLGKSLMKHCSPKLYKHLVSAGLKKRAKILNQFFKIEPDSIQDVDKDKLFKDVSSDLKVSQPTHKITSDFGPSGWATTYLGPGPKGKRHPGW